MAQPSSGVLTHPYSLDPLRRSYLLTNASERGAVTVATILQPDGTGREHVWLSPPQTLLFGMHDATFVKSNAVHIATALCFFHPPPPPPRCKGFSLFCACALTAWDFIALGKLLSTARRRLLIYGCVNSSTASIHSLAFDSCNSLRLYRPNACILNFLV